ncbi:MAG: SPOR domain-containing protein [Myxococcales bacterium]|nr:MAG: SPOR domain-containing protein [Myxococcales bacterium]
MGRRADSEYRFSIVHLAVLAASMLLTACAVFLLGFYVGRESAALHTPIDERVARLPTEDSEASPRHAPRPEERIPTPSKDPAPGTPSAPAPPVAPTVRPAPAGGSGAIIPYTVQVLATRERSEAESIRGQLLKRSIGAFISEVEDGVTRWYRVRIGRYDDLDAARLMEARVRREMGFSQATIVPAATERR